MRWRRRFLGKMYASSADALIVHQSKSCLKREEQPLPAASSDHEGRLKRGSATVIYNDLCSLDIVLIFSHVYCVFWCEYKKGRTDPAKSADNPGMSHECQIQSVTSLARHKRNRTSSSLESMSGTWASWLQDLSTEFRFTSRQFHVVDSELGCSARN